MKLHTTIVSWMVQLLVKDPKGKTAENADNEFQVLHQDVTRFKLAHVI